MPNRWLTRFLIRISTLFHKFYSVLVQPGGCFKGGQRMTWRIRSTAIRRIHLGAATYARHLDKYCPCDRKNDLQLSSNFKFVICELASLNWGWLGLIMKNLELKDDKNSGRICDLPLHKQSQPSFYDAHNYIREQRCFWMPYSLLDEAA
jgi:hypothetical protein